MGVLMLKTAEDIRQLNERISHAGQFIDRMRDEIGHVVVGQSHMLDRLLIGLLSNGHILLEGVPGLAKTLTIKSLSQAIHAKFSRIQFTPDLLPADVIGTMIYNQQRNEFVVRKGPIFGNFILADEINRAPAKVQSALLEAMQERQVTIGEQTFKLPDPFLVLATQNPIEQEGTYPLPEAQVDRFMLKLSIQYPSKQEEREIMDRMAETGKQIVTQPVVTPEQILKARKVVDSVYMDDKIKNYIVDLVFATRDPKSYNIDIAGLIQYGASPRASIYLNIAAKAYAFLQGRGYVTPQDVKTIGMDVLRHRVIVSYEAEAEDMTSESVIKRIFDEVPVP